MDDYEDLIEDEDEDEPNYDNVIIPITVNLLGLDSNAFIILGVMLKELKRAKRDGKCTQEQIDDFQAEATAGDYDHLLATCMKWVDVQ